MQTAKKVLTNIIPTTEVTATKGTVAWVEALYEAGAVTFEPDGSIALNSEIKMAIDAMHAILAGGDVSIEIKEKGGLKCEELNRIFQTAWEEANSANKNRSNGDVKVPPMSP